MARITAGVASSHVPLLGVAVDQGKDRDDYFGPIFAGYDWTREWEKAEKPDVVILKVDEGSNTKITVVRSKIEGVVKESTTGNA